MSNKRDDANQGSTRREPNPRVERAIDRTLESLDHLREINEEQRSRVKDVLKRALEGELIELAVAPRPRGQGTDFSKSTSHYHSSSGHCFSKFDRAEALASTAALYAENRDDYVRFADTIIALKKKQAESGSE